MQFDAATIERMVRDVLNQIQAPAPTSSKAPGLQKLLSVSDAKAAVPDAKPTVAVETKVPITPPRVVLADRIITAEVLKERVKPASQIVIAPKSIITPAAQDFLRLNRITWERGIATSNSNLPASVTWWILISTASESVNRGIAAVCQQRSGVKHELVGTAIEAAIATVTAISRAEVPGIVIVSSEPNAVACRVNRNHSVRAAVVSDVKAWSNAEATLYPNVACIDPTERSFMELQNILNRIVSKRPATAPAGWEM